MEENEPNQKKELTPELLHERAQIYAKSEEKIQVLGELKDYLGFCLGEEKYLVDINFVEEVLEPTKIFQIPRGVDYLLGTMNIRGRITLIADLGIFLNQLRTELKEGSKIIVLRVGKELTGFPVDEVYESMKLDTGTIQRPILTAKGVAAENMEGLFKKGEMYFIWLKIENVLLEMAKRLSK